MDNGRAGQASPLLLAMMVVMVVMQIPCTSCQASWFVQTPHDANLLEGDSVILNCQLDIWRVIEHSEYKVTWSKNGEELDFTNPNHSHYWLTGDVHSAQYYLLISNADLDDAGAFSCTVFENIETDSGMTQWVMHADASAMVQVYVRPPPPECNKIDLDVASNYTDINYEGDLIELSCVGYLSDPSFILELIWKNRVITEEDGATVHIDEENVQEQAFRFSATYEENGASFQCRLTSPKFQDYNETCEMVALNIVHEPKLDFVSDKTEVYQGESLIVACITISNPTFVSFNWYTDPVQSVVFREGGHVLEVPSVSSSTGVLNITCEVSNDHGVAKASRLVLVLNRNAPEATETVVPLTTERGVYQPEVSTTSDFKTVTKPIDKATTPTKTTKLNNLSYSGGTISTQMIAVLAIVPSIIIAIFILIFVFLYKTVKLSTKRRDDQIRVIYQDGATVIGRHTHGGRGNLNVVVQPAVNEGATVPTTMEPGVFSMPPPYTKDGLPSVLGFTNGTMAASGQDSMYYEEKTDNTYVDMQGQLQA